VDRVSLVTFVGGHSKNNCDRVFGRISQELCLHDILNAEDWRTVVGRLTGVICLDMEDPEEQFRDWKAALSSWGYRRVPGIKASRWIEMSAADKGWATISNLPPKALLDSIPLPADKRELLPEYWEQRVEIIRSCSTQVLNAPVDSLNGLSEKKLADMLKCVYKYVPRPQRDRWPWNAMPLLKESGGKLMQFEFRRLLRGENLNIREAENEEEHQEENEEEHQEENEEENLEGKITFYFRRGGTEELRKELVYKNAVEEDRRITSENRSRGQQRRQANNREKRRREQPEGEEEEEEEAEVNRRRKRKRKSLAEVETEQLVLVVQ
jgi:hypothetical protein